MTAGFAAFVVVMMAAKVFLGRIEDRQGGSDRLAQIERRLDLLEASGPGELEERRLSDLEARIDFTERLLQAPRGAPGDEEEPR